MTLGGSPLPDGDPLRGGVGQHAQSAQVVVTVAHRVVYVTDNTPETGGGGAHVSVVLFIVRISKHLHL